MEPLNLRVPILQAPIGGSTCPELAAAVSNAGGMGSLALTWSSAEDAVQAVEKTRELTDRTFFVNFALAFEPLALDAVLRAGVPMVTFSFGDPGDLVRKVKDAGALVGIQVGDPQGARMAVAHEANIVICQGTEAGGHVQSQRSVWDLIPECREILGPIPLIAAGGISSGVAIAAALSVGADGVMMGTRFLVTKESRAHSQYKALLIRAESVSSYLTTCFEDGWPRTPQRVLINKTLNDWEEAGRPKPGSRPGEGDILGAYDDATPIYRYSMNQPTHGVNGEIEEMCLYAGSAVGEIKSEPTVAELIEEIWRECTSTLGLP